ncbi:hypothetical protein DOY81_007121 [Sarcophaga bullata]|nr:hypothetical protein DOY81_007121 [Sarcophaga bullata]
MPTDSVYVEEDPELTDGFFEGDMDIDLTRNVIINTAKRWPNKIVRYKFGSGFDVDHVLHVLQGMKSIESVSCIRFLPASDTATGYVKITGATTGCHSRVGYTGTMQILNLQLNTLNKGCFRTGAVIHEMLHALGFFHQHSASNRDDYVKIFRQNIQDGRESSFNKFDSSFITDFGVGYDYSSVMHYGPKAFSKNGLNTIVPLKENVQIGQQSGLSQKDILKLNKMYKCNV